MFDWVHMTRKEKKRMEESAGFWPELLPPESWGDELTPPLMFFTVPGTPPGTEVQDLVANLPSLASDHHPSHTLPSNQECFQFASSCSHTYKTLPLLSSVSKFHASITGCETCPTDSSSSPKRKDQGAAPLLLPLPLLCSASICILGANIHISGLWPKYKNQRDRSVFHSYFYILPWLVVFRTYWISYIL